jgi:hypothetical protein
LQTYFGVEIEYDPDFHVYIFSVNGWIYETATLEEAKLTIKELN